jgi:hypothetical protein
MVSILAVYHKKLKISTPWDEKKNFFDNILTTESRKKNPLWKLTEEIRTQNSRAARVHKEFGRAEFFHESAPAFRFR